MHRYFPLLLAILVLVSTVSQGLAVDASGAAFFEREIRPLLIKYCDECHSEKKQEGGLRLDSRAVWEQGGDSGPAIVPNNLDDSLIIKALRYTDLELQMPPNGKLKDDEIAAFEAWVKLGAPDPRETVLPAVASKEGMNVEFKQAAEQHWAFQRISRPSLPEVSDSKWPRNAIDSFILSKLDGHAMQPEVSANRRTLIRRLYFDLTGLAPTPEEVWEFQNNDSPNAYEDLIDRLLASPFFGERWGRHWLDVARYADSSGYEDDHDRPTVWHYRDFVIRALNEDMPFNQFVAWQIAGDALAPSSVEAKMALAFIGLGPEVKFVSKLPSENTSNRYNDLDDMLSTTSQALLGLTLGCARCHDHKFDPIPTRDYYRMLSAFTPLVRHELPLVEASQVTAYQQAFQLYEVKLTEAKSSLDRWVKAMKESLRADLENQRSSSASKKKTNSRPTDADYRRFLSDDQRDEWDRLAAVVKNVELERPPPLPTAMTMATMEEPPRNVIMIRGEPNRPGDEVTFGFLSALMRDKSPKDFLEASGNWHRASENERDRAALAAWITDVDHGAGSLLARVIVNRLWQHHFGEGLVRTPSDFGRQGDLPSHPELLDWLADELVKGGWHLKPIHRLIVASSTYRQRGVTQERYRESQASLAKRLVAYRRPQRLEAEILRDHILSVSGCLNRELHGPSVKAPIPSELNTAYNTKDPYPTNVVDGPESWRRSLYLFTKRSLRQPLLEAFDGADPSVSCAQRISTAVAPQALALMNDRWVRARAHDFANRLVREVGDAPDMQVRYAYRLTLCREPLASELEASLSFVAAQASQRAKQGEADGQQLALADFCHVLFGLNEFIYVD